MAPGRPPLHGDGRWSFLGARAADGHDVEEAGIAFDVEALKQATIVIVAANTAQSLTAFETMLNRKADAHTVEPVTLAFAERGQ